MFVLFDMMFRKYKVGRCMKIIIVSLFMFSFVSMQINMTSLQALGRARLNAGIRKALTCGNVPRDQLCSHMVDG